MRVVHICIGQCLADIGVLRKSLILCRSDLPVAIQWILCLYCICWIADQQVAPTVCMKRLKY